MSMPVTGRFAPTPSGRLHLGNLLCALLAYLSARHADGRFLLRIEDLDAPRCPKRLCDAAIQDLTWLGITWDEPPLFQSERGEIYQRYARQLEQKGLLYPCFCTRAQLHAAAAPNRGDDNPVYAGTCAHLSPEEIAERMKTRRPAIRLRVPDETISIWDCHYGEYSEYMPRDCGDFIIRRSDGVFAYQLAVTVDDGLMGVTEVVRGSDLIGSTARQIWLHRLFGFEPPAFYHMPLLLAPDGRRLSKRDEDLDLGLLRTRMRPERLVGALAFAAGLIDREEAVSARELVKGFSWDKIPKTDLYLPDIFRNL